MDYLHIFNAKFKRLAKYKVSHPGFYAFSIASLAILLMLCGILISGLFFSDHYARKFKEDIVLLCELKDDDNEADVEKVTAFLNSENGIVEGSVEFVSSEDALEEMYGLLGEDATMTDDENPFADMVEFSIESDSFTLEYVEHLSSRMEKELPVRQVHYPSDYFDNVFGVIRMAKHYLMIFIIVALVMTGVLIHHIMRLNVVAQQGQIRTMELVGAKPGFIRRPFIRRGLQMGLRAWLAAVILSAIAWYVLLGPGMFLGWLFSVPGITGMLVLLLLSILVCGFSTWLAVNRSLGSSIMQE